MVKNTTWKCEFYGLHEKRIHFIASHFLRYYIFYIDYQRSEWQLKFSWEFIPTSFIFLEVIMCDEYQIAVIIAHNVET